MNVLVLAAEEPLPVLPYPGELIVGIIAFGILLFVLNKFAVPRFEAMYRERVDAIEGGLRRAEERRAEADELKARYEEQMAGVRAERARILDDARAEASQIRADARTQADEETDRIRTRGEEQIAASRDAAARQLRGEVGSLSVELAERLLGSSLSDDSRRSATIDAFLDDLGSSRGPEQQPARAT